MSLLTTIKNRWNAECPSFFKKVKRNAITIGTSATAVWVANSSMSLELHPYILDFCKYAIAGCAATGLTAQLTQVDPNQAS